MEKKLAGLLGAVGALVVSAPGQATPVQPSDSVMQANSYSDLLKPIPNAAEVLRGLQGQPEAKVELAQYYYRHHHHHHHHAYYQRRTYHHHHHHHHHHRPVLGVVIR